MVPYCIIFTKHNVINENKRTVDDFRSQRDYQSVRGAQLKHFVVTKSTKAKKLSTNVSNVLHKFSDLEFNAKYNTRFSMKLWLLN